MAFINIMCLLHFSLLANVPVRCYGFKINHIYPKFGSIVIYHLKYVWFHPHFNPPRCCIIQQYHKSYRKLTTCFTIFFVCIMDFHKYEIIRKKITSYPKAMMYQNEEAIEKL